ncbi:hypothetical protein KEM56_006840 [Ascosphaera pollenicola]|nr:hypothetical protein KEM56_006840 [Ascosphaera pollenicola]
MLMPSKEKAMVRPVFTPGKIRPPGSNYTRTLVIARTKEENTDWIAQALPDLHTAIYVANDDQSPLHPPVNKGHEAMIYLTYLIDNYKNLPDISIFMHAHRYAWHNAELLSFDAVRLIQQLRDEKVMYDGYVNTRCVWAPGCPDWIKPKNKEPQADKPEQAEIGKAWTQLFPFEPVPELLGQPCCSQFALSKDRVRSIPLERLKYVRDWLLKTDLDDQISGRVFEYMWQVLFTNDHMLCPLQHVCWCETYGLCFESAEHYTKVEDLRMSMEAKRVELATWRIKKAEFDEARSKGDIKALALLQMPKENRDLELMGELQEGARKMKEEEIMAIARGKGYKYKPGK